MVTGAMCRTRLADSWAIGGAELPISRRMPELRYTALALRAAVRTGGAGRTTSPGWRRSNGFLGGAPRAGWSCWGTSISGFRRPGRRKGLSRRCYGPSMGLRPQPPACRKGNLITSCTHRTLGVLVRWALGPGEMPRTTPVGPRWRLGRLRSGTNILNARPTHCGVRRLRCRRDGRPSRGSVAAGERAAIRHVVTSQRPKGRQIATDATASAHPPRSR